LFIVDGEIFGDFPPGVKLDLSRLEPLSLEPPPAQISEKNETAQVRENQRKFDTQQKKGTDLAGNTFCSKNSKTEKMRAHMSTGRHGDSLGGQVDAAWNGVRKARMLQSLEAREHLPFGSPPRYRYRYSYILFKMNICTLIHVHTSIHICICVCIYIMYV